ncbi:peptidylprolyl isomerase [Stenoxybacter acetivorans]|uniref:peptidylprolyl isomerase n=1 Tax=Stenoxybacter acetivorans TaxID=422441 RepID=UPI00055B1EC2|nr:peptidylprolyl isomerase [Stenoxybacter acetivorans]
MKKTIWVLGAIVAGLAFADAPTVSPERVNVLLKEMQAKVQMQKMYQPDEPVPSNEELTKEATRQLQTVDVLKAEALKAGLDKKAETLAALENLQAQFYASEYVAYLQSKIEVDEADVRQRYDFLTREVKLLVIEFPDKAAGESGLGKLKKGMAFETLLKQVNPDAPTDVWITPRDLPPPITHLASQLNVGQITGQVIDLDGRYYLLKLAGTRPGRKAPSFAEVKGQVAAQIKEEKAQEEIAALLKQNGIE